MRLLDQLKSQAVIRGLIGPDTVLNAAVVFTLVRDMPYRRASDRRPETILAEWRGTCSGKHYLLHALLAEMGFTSQIMACTSAVPVDAGQVSEGLRPLYEAANHRFVDVHNYLLLDLGGGRRMIVDATWPLSARDLGMQVNEDFILGQDQRLAAVPLQTWPVPKDQDPQDFKDKLLRENFTAAELEFREVVIQAFSNRT
jgi:hypothetical protein